MTTIKLRSLLPVQTDGALMEQHCAAFRLTLVGWGKTAHSLEVTVAEDVTPEQQQAIAAAMTAQLAATLVTVATP
jgi:uncharacterized protein YejL (UPF0352 family)